MRYVGMLFSAGIAYVLAAHGMALGSSAGTGMWSSLMESKSGGQTATQAPQRVHISWSRISLFRSKNGMSLVIPS